MPELPEVETVRRGLAPILVGATLKRALTKRGDLRFPFPPRFAKRLEGARVTALTRRAKYLLAALDTGEIWTMHLGMSGRFVVYKPEAPKRPLGDFYYAEPPDPAHTHVVVETDNGARIEYNDPRRFGYMDLIAADEIAVHPWFAALGPEPLENDFNGAHLAAMLKGKKTSVKAALLDQRVVAGLGNIYVCEALFRTRIDPRRLAGKISRVRLDALADEVRAVLGEALAAGGSTLRDYAAADGREGAFQQRFRVYDREGEGCRGCNRAIRRLVQAGRSTFYCAHCQR